jgi:hypothetical protein
MTKKLSIRILSLSFLIVFFSSLPSFALPVTGTVSMSTGGTGRGTVEPTDSVLLNPAIVAQIPTSYISLNYTRDQYGITISDNGKEALFPAAVAFNRSNVNDVKTQDMTLVVAYSPKPKLSFGIGASLVEYSLDNSANDQKYNQTVADLGMTYAFTKDFAFGVVAYKAFSSQTDFNQALQKQRTVGAGMNYTYLNFVRFRYDIESAPDNKFNRLIFMSGLETFLNDWMILRLGYQNNNVVSKNFLSAGIGFAGPQFGFHYGYLTNPADHADDRHSVDLGIPF